MPTLRLNHGLVLLDAAFSHEILAKTDQGFLRNILLFGASASDAASGANENAALFLKAAAQDDSKLLTVLAKAADYASRNAGSADQINLLNLVAVVMQMMGVEFSSEPRSF